MIRYTPENQLSIEEFKTPVKISLSTDNRWVILSKLVPWDKFALKYISMMNAGFGRPGVSPRIVLGALIIKHMGKLDDRGVIEAIQENIYMQFFLGLSEFTTKPVFDPSLFVEIRRRIGVDIFDALNVDLIQSISAKADKRHLKNAENNVDELPKNKGKMQADATVADQYITYPTDSGLLNTSRKECQKMIDFLYEANGKTGVKPRTYRKKLDQAFLNYSKKKKKAKKVHRKMNRTLLEAVRRNLGHIEQLLNNFEAREDYFPLNHKSQRMLWIVQHLFGEQKTMYDTKHIVIPIV